MCVFWRCECFLPARRGRWIAADAEHQGRSTLVPPPNEKILAGNKGPCLLMLAVVAPEVTQLR